MSFTKTTLVAILLFCYTAVFSQQTHLTKIVNIAAKQRMLVQRLAKDKVYIKIKENKDQAKAEMQATFSTFDKGLKVLKEFSPNSEISHKIGLVEFSYDVYKKIINDNSKESMNEVIKYNTLFLNTCEDLLVELLKYSKNLTNKDSSKNQQYVLSNVSGATAASGKLRYLTQRLNLYYELNRNGFISVDPEQINNLIRNMDKNLNYLTVLEFNTMQIDDSLSEVIFQLNNLKKSISTNGEINLEADISSRSLFHLCNTVLQSANSTTKMYADLGKELNTSSVGVALNK